MNVSRFTLLGLSATLLIAAGGPGANPATAAPQPRPSLAGPPAPGSGLSSVLSEIGPDGAVPRQTALEAFTLGFGPLPGVSAVPGPPGERADGTIAVNWVLRYWDQLTVAQKTAIKKYLPEAPVTNLAGTAGRGIALGTFVAGPITPPSGPYLSMLEHDRSEIAAHVGHSMALPLSVVVSSTQTKTYLAYTTVYDSSGGFTGPPARCQVTIEPRLLHFPDASAVADSLMHEMFHCFQATDYATVAAYVKAPDWLIEGSAAWVGEELAPSPSTSDGWWQEYLLDIGKSLFARSYDAIGFFAHMEETGADPWHSFDPMFKAHTSAAAYALATDHQFKLTWASSLLRKTDFGDGWDTTGPTIPNVGFVPTVHVLAAGQALSGKVSPYTNAIVGVNTNANALEVSVNTPYSRLHDSTNHDFNDLDTSSNRFCLNNCSADTELEALPRLTGGEVWLAITGDSAGATYSDQRVQRRPVPGRRLGDHGLDVVELGRVGLRWGRRPLHHHQFHGRHRFHRHGTPGRAQICWARGGSSHLSPVAYRHLGHSVRAGPAQQRHHAERGRRRPHTGLLCQEPGAQCDGHVELLSENNDLAPG